MNVRDLVNFETPPESSPLGGQSSSNHMLSIPPSRAPSPTNAPTFSRRASIVLIGMRGVGKTTLGTIASKALGWELLDTDLIFEQQQGVPIAKFISTYGWEEFRKVESKHLETILPNNLTGKVIACGGGVVELERNRAILQRFRDHGPVIHVLREKDAVLAYLRDSPQYPPFLHETAKEAWDRREQLFRDCCSFEFVSLTMPVPPAPKGFKDIITPDQTFALKPVEEDFFRLLRFIHGVDTKKVTLSPRGPRSYSLSLTFEDVRQAIPVLDELSTGIDLWELRVDLLSSCEPTFLAFQIAILRHHSPLPILFTLRTVSQGGRYPDVSPQNEKAVKIQAWLHHHALRLGVEYIDLEVVMPESTFTSVVEKKGNTIVMGSYNDWAGTLNWASPQTRHLFEKMTQLHVDIVKIVGAAKSFEDNMALRQFAGLVERSSTPLLAINVGPEGKISRALNPILSPVSHPLLPRAAGPGQISFYETQSILYLTGLLPAKKYYVFGRPIGHSMSPTIHNTAFSYLGLPHSYSIKETATVGELKEVMLDPNFGGASVTIPYKVEIMPYMQHISRHARVIGAVNTVTSIPGGGLSGDNTDWRAIKSCLTRSLTPANVVTSSTTALVLGAGGTCRATLYALHQIGVINIFIWNRTRRRAELLAEEFSKLDPLLRIRVLDRLDVQLPIRPLPTMIISTIPAAAPTSSELIDVGLRIEHLSDAGGVAIELGYERRITRLLSLAQEKRDQGIAWAVVEGIEILLEQGYEQFKIWTGRRAPARKVQEKVLEVYEQRRGLQSPPMQ
ncbi:shikimate-5-dehydrogenase [Gymnopus androsaceus JB14]|uniref:shikimate kinase n=1 Tax=Gymnopus androsaceus JB14 TaxID=1447944 RepID=A0A6A4IJE9_9AGAR|nr:shikimate-5-dehydrogenase [Gymnopus androsaceus JB14]